MPSTELVEKVKESRWMKDGEMVTTYYVTLVDGTGEREVPCYSPMGKDLKEDAPLSDGWEVKTSKAGKLYLAAPKATGGSSYGGGSGKSSWYNSEEGVRLTQERTDRRTALMQAVIKFTSDDKLEGADLYPSSLLKCADEFYAWLRKNLDVSAPGVGGAVFQAAPRETSVEVKTDSGQRVGADIPLDGGGVEPGEASSPSSANTDGCPICGKGWGPNTTSSGKRLCVAGHVERFDG